MSDFIFRFPLRILAINAVRDAGGIVQSCEVHYVKGEAGQLALAVFTDEDAARSHAARLGTQGVEIAAFPNPASFVRLLRREQAGGATHVAFDPYFPARKTTVVPMDHAIEALEKQGHE